METPSTFLLLLLLLALLRTSSALTKPVDVGVVLDLGSEVGRMCRLCLDMGFEDFYGSHPGFRTRVVMHVRDSGNDSVGAASAALDLIKNAQVQAILGPQRSAQAGFVINLGTRLQVPVVSFSVTSPSFSPSKMPYFIRTALNSLFGVKALSSLVKLFGWRNVVLIYEDTEYGYGLLPHIVDGLQEVDARVPYRSGIPVEATDLHITKELYKLMTMPTRVFLVHMLPPLSSRLFSKAKEMGMVEGYVWIITEGLTNILNVLDKSTIDSMQGVVGIRTYVHQSEDLKNFRARWRARSSRGKSNEENLTTYGLWAYDTARAIALGVEKAGTDDLSFKMKNVSVESNDLAKLGTSNNGPRLREAIRKTQFKGISGDFVLVDGQLRLSTFQFVNVVGNKVREVGFWSPAHGLSSQQDSVGMKKYSASKIDLPIIWPGNLTAAPKGWEIPTNGNVLRIGIPVKGGFVEFVNTKTPIPSGYCLDVFDAVMKSLPYVVQYKYFPFNLAQHPGTYDQLIDQVIYQNFDAVVGDVTIIANRSLYVDFTLPYTESGVSMVVRVKQDQNNNGWIFLKPFSMPLWLGSLAFFFYTGFVVWVIEHRINEEFRGVPSQQMGTIFYFAFSTLVYAHRGRLQSNLSRFMVVIWLFVVLILTSSYIASLASMLTVQRLQPSATNVNELLKSGASVGYQDGSFVLGLLKRLKFDESKLKKYSNPVAFAYALDKGSQHGGIDAIFDEIPYINLFLANRRSKYVMVGPTYKADGFGFVFPKGSPLVPDVSRAVLNVTQGEQMLEIEKKWFGDQTASPPESSIVSSNKLEFCSFWGLFLITGVVSLVSLLIFFSRYLYYNSGELERAMASESSVWDKLVASMKHYDNKDNGSSTFRKNNEVACAESVSAMTNFEASTRSVSAAGSESPGSVFNQEFEFNNCVPPDDSAPSVELSISNNPGRIV